jgi:hypothetical protein
MSRKGKYKVYPSCNHNRAKENAFLVSNVHGGRGISIFAS